MLRRALLCIAFFISILFLPWWVTVALAIVYAFSYSAYEIIFGGLLMDALYGAPVPLFGEATVVFTAVFVLLFVGAEFLKEHLAWYAR